MLKWWGGFQWIQSIKICSYTFLFEKLIKKFKKFVSSCSFDSYSNTLRENFPFSMTSRLPSTIKIPKKRKSFKYLNTWERFQKISIFNEHPFCPAATKRSYFEPYFVQKLQKLISFLIFNQTFLIYSTHIILIEKYSIIQSFFGRQAGPAEIKLNFSH